MTDLRIAAQQALEALYQAREFTELYDTEHAAAVNERCHENITALRAALAQQAEPVQEPVAWMVYTLDGKSVCVTDNPADFTDEHKALPLYATPQPETAQREPVAWSTHSAECWQWHQACAVAKVKRLEGAVTLAMSIVDDARRHGYALKHDEADALVARLRKVYEGRE